MYIQRLIEYDGQISNFEMLQIEVFYFDGQHLIFASSVRKRYENAC